MPGPTAQPDGPVGFVLAGGGTKGAFEVGVVSHLVGAAGLVPTVVTAASAGSIVGSKLAQARTSAEMRARAEELRHDLLAMSDIDVVFGRQPWLADLQDTPFGQAINGFLEMRPPTPGVPDAAAPPTRAHHRHRSFHALQQVLASLPALGRAKRHAAEGASSFLTLDPLEAALTGATPAGVLLGEFTGSSGIAPLDPALIERPGLSLRLAITALGEGVTRYVTETGVIVEADALTRAASHPEPVTVAEGVLTSSSAPMVFPPRRLGSVDYADGGVAQNLPVAAAVALGARHIVAIVATTVATPPVERDYRDANFLEIHLRSSQIMFSDHQRANLGVAVPDGTVVTAIAPTLDLVGAFEVNEGLMRIDMDYGALRAAETLAELAPDDRARAMVLTDRAVAARDRAWFLEEDLWRGDDSGGRLDALRRCKDEVRSALEERASLVPLPDGVDGWWTGWESHAAPRPEGLPDRP